MDEELEKSLQIIRGRTRNALDEKDETIKLFRSKINSMISKNQTGEFRNELCDLSILFEIFLINDGLVHKLKI